MDCCWAVAPPPPPPFDVEFATVLECRQSPEALDGVRFGPAISAQRKKW